MTFCLGGCSELQPEKSEQTAQDTGPTQSFRNLELRETSEGKLEWVLRARQAWRQSSSAPTQMESLRVDFYQGTTEIRSVLTADSGRVDSRKGRLMAKGSVVVITREGNRLETEELYWDRKEAKVYSDLAVRLEQKTDVLTGVGFESDPNLEHFRLFKDIHASVTEEGEIEGGLFGADSSARTN